MTTSSSTAIPPGIETRIVAVRVKKFSEQELQIEPNEVAGARFTVSFAADMDEENSSVTVGVHVAIQVGPNENDVEDFLDAEVVCRFQLRNLDGLRNQDGSVRIPRLLVASLFGISLSTTRGVILGKTGFSDVAERFPVPIMSPMDIVVDFASASESEWIASE